MMNDTSIFVCMLQTGTMVFKIRQHSMISRAGTKSGSRARSLVLVTMLAPVVENRTVEGPARARRRRELGNRRPLYGGQLSSPPYSGRRFANLQRQRGPAGPSNYVFCANASSITGVVM